MFKKTLLAAAALISLSVVAQPASAGISINGISINGITINGLTFNGLTLNGLTFNGTTAESAAPTVESITLPSGVTLTVR